MSTSVSHLKFCPECQKEGKKSLIDEGPITTTLMGCFTFYDENGKRHYHDPNVKTFAYRCSRDHEWTEDFKVLCWCQQ